MGRSAGATAAAAAWLEAVPDVPLGLGRGRLGMNHVQVQEFLEGVEVAIAVKQGVILLDAECGDPCERRLTHCRCKYLGDL